MASATTSNTKAWSQPIDHYKHVIFMNDKYYELSCPSCGGNARGDNPHLFFTTPSGFVQHINNVHRQEGDALVDTKGWLTGQTHRELSDEDVASILAGDALADEVIQRKPIVKQHGAQAVVHRPNHEYETIILDNYPTVARRKDGTYITLACCYCSNGGNARKVRGAVGKKAPKNVKLDFMHGALGLKVHISQAHQGTTGNNVEELLELCGTPITNARYQQLKTDMEGGLIDKVEAEMEEVKGHKGTVKKRAMAKKATGRKSKKAKVADTEAHLSDTTTPMLMDQTAPKSHALILVYVLADGLFRQYSSTPFSNTNLPTGSYLIDDNNGNGNVAAQQTVSGRHATDDKGENIDESASIASPSIAPATNTEGAMSQHEAGVFKHENGRVLSPREVNWRKTHGYYPFTTRSIEGRQR